MAFLSNIKAGIFSRTQREKAKSPYPKAAVASVHPDRVREITIIFLADSADDRRVVDRWRDECQKNGRKVNVVGYFEQEVGAANFDFTVVTVKDLKWSGVPTGAVVDQLQSATTELLIRLGPTEHAVLDFLSATTAADLKVGPYTEATQNPYHLQFETGQDATLKTQLATIAHIFSYTNASKTTTKV